MFLELWKGYSGPKTPIVAQQKKQGKNRLLSRLCSGECECWIVGFLKVTEIVSHNLSNLMTERCVWVCVVEVCGEGREALKLSYKQF